MTVNNKFKRIHREITLTARSIAGSIFLVAKKAVHVSALWVADKTT